ncbi:hypothetical protein [Polyangium mundeleinium]|uniref:Ferritin-like domain-containing protein n=1 Tax=Polyangium mundeleinium TaxID=2995306 RepID=A0ABT5EYI3_9BACT|nr:hypothetical protein [Polyangium mundeleinium]MDC0746454.1 hypothetical protein [Polyangium mundeleinium]
MKRSFPVIPSTLGALVAAGAVTLVPSTAAALGSDGAHGMSLGLTLSYSIGARAAFGIGGDLRYTYYQDAPDGLPHGSFVGLGAFFQGTYLIGGAGRFAFGAHANMLTDVVFDLDTEFGATIRTKSKVGEEPGGVGIHLGLAPLFNPLLLETGPTFRGSIAVTQGMQSEFIVGGDIRAPGPCVYFQCFQVVSGRPLRPAPNAEATLAPLLVGPPDPTRPRTKGRALSRGAQERLLSHWARTTSAECASVPAFRALARDLSRAGAPDALVSRALLSAKEEATHTALCAALANEGSPARLSPLLPSIPEGSDRDLASLLRKLALESFWDGCVGEGAAAAEARRALRDTTDEPAREALSVIARDEQGHADLSERIVAFCLSAGGKPVRDALVESVERRRSIEEARLSAHVEVGAEDAEARAFGVPAADVGRIAREEAFEASMRLVA